MLRLRFPIHRFALVAALVAVFGVSAALSQNADTVHVKITPADRMAAQHSVVVSRHALPTHTPPPAPSREPLSIGSRASANNAKSAPPPDQRGIRYPGDLSYHGGPTVQSAESHAIYMLPNGTCPVATCWGNPEGFLAALGESEFIHVVDQYTGQFRNDRYTNGSDASVNYTPPSVPFTDADMQAVVHAVASQTGLTGYGHIYHVFLPPGQDECFTSADTTCYSPDNFATFFFCAYHSSVDFPDIGHVLYSVEPFQDVVGCSSRPNGPNGQLIDSTNNVLSHETFETITDPDGTAWWNSLDNGLYGQEIGDECSFLLFTATNVYFDPSIFRVDDHLYAAQPEYDNSVHACSIGPGGR
jgi:hypothetical protein